MTPTPPSRLAAASDGPSAEPEAPDAWPEDANERREDGTAPADEVWHFSEDPTIVEFRPHVAATARRPTPYVWACTGPRCPDYWFARQTPRAMAWRTPTTDPTTADALLGTGVARLHVIEYDVVETMTTARLFAYRFPAAGFADLDGYASVSRQTQVPLGPPIALASPWRLHQTAGIPVLVVPNLFPWWSEVITSGLGFSGIRLRNSPNHPG